MIREKEEILAEIQEKTHLKHLFNSWNWRQQEEFLNFCSGVRGVKILYDSFFKEIMNPEYAPERLDDLLSQLLRKQVKILCVLPGDSTRIADESSLLITDIVVQMEDGSLGNIEVQKIGYLFPGERSACYSADLLLRQYKRVRSELQEKFNYKNIQNVYTIVFYEKSPKSFQKFSHNYLHYFSQQSDTGLKMKLLQEYLFISLDIFQKNKHNKIITNKLDAWLMFLSTDDPETIIRLITAYPEFRPLYEEVYGICRNMEKIMGIFSEELRQMDRNTVQLMIDQMQETLEQKKEELEQQNAKLEQQSAELEQQSAKLEQQSAALEQQSAKLEQQSAELEQQDKLLKSQAEKLAASESASIARVRKKYIKEVPSEQCAEMLEEEPARIQRIYHFLAAYPDLDDRQIADKLNQEP